ncbi:MAG TPA: hypothetical protein VFI29_13465 [Hanamia sp.]|nr:hypothetical protein [Hanamia sp.]
MEIPKYDKKNGISYNWKNGFEIETKIQSGEIIIIANREGLISLANHLLNLAQDDIPSGYHMHFDENNSLEAGSTEIIIQKK